MKSAPPKKKPETKVELQEDKVEAFEEVEEVHMMSSKPKSKPEPASSVMKSAPPAKADKQKDKVETVVKDKVEVIKPKTNSVFDAGVQMMEIPEIKEVKEMKSSLPSQIDKTRAVAPAAAEASRKNRYQVSDSEDEESIVENNDIELELPQVDDSPKQKQEDKRIHNI